MKLKRKLLVSLFAMLGVGATVATVAPIVVSCSSGSSGSGNSTNNPKPLPEANTSNITTYQQARQFTNEYLKKNYTLANLISDTNQYTKSHEDIINSIPEGSCTFSITYKSNSSWNNVDLTAKYSVENKQQNISQTIEHHIYNLPINIEFVYNKQQGYIYPTLNIHYSPNLGLSSNTKDKIYNTLEELKTNNPDYQNKIYGDVTLLVKDKENNETLKKYFILDSTNFNNNKILNEEMAKELITIQNIFKFSNIKDIEQNLYNPSSNNTPTPSEPQPTPSTSYKNL